MNIPTSPELKSMTGAEITSLTEEIRLRIIDAVSASGGHLASNLGVVEMTVALHRVFDIPTDSIVFDVGHQCYTHKILTGRAEQMTTLRRAGGLSGFPSRAESDADPFTTGHSGTSLSAALGMAEANRLAGRDAWTVAVIGDGSFTNGMIYEAMNGCAQKGLRLMIVLNDNEMSISKNVGAMTDYFAKIRTSRPYFMFKHGVHRFCKKIPLIGRGMIRIAIVVKEFIKRVLNRKNIFENFGLEYLGPIDGADIDTLESVFREAKRSDVPCVVHVITQKGHGYLPAEEHPERYHSVSPFTAESGVSTEAKGFSRAFGDALCEAAAKDDRICAVSAAMKDGTGLARFADTFPERFFDVGIAEEHAVTFAAGLARAGMRPVVALYSTFSQRVFDQMLHDCALQKLPVVLALDRCGVIPGDGVTHQGLFDVGLFSPIPGITVYAPESYAELSACLAESLADTGVSIVRYPRGEEAQYDRSIWTYIADGSAAVADFGEAERRITLITYSSETAEVLPAAEALAHRFTVRVIRLIRISPLPVGEILEAIGETSTVSIAEESMRRGGVGESLAAQIAAARPSLPVRVCAVDSFVPHGVTAKELPISAEAIVRSVIEAVQ